MSFLSLSLSLSLSLLLVSLDPLAATTDISALLSFKSVLSPTAALSSWSPNSSNPCSWQYVTCNPSNQVTFLNLTSLGLAGPLSPSVFLLPHLVLIDLSFNSLSGPIPNTFTNLSSLQNLTLSANSLTGPIPSSLSLLPSLTYLRLDRNTLIGSIPDSLSLLPLNYLYLRDNNLTGPIPSWTGRSAILIRLSLATNFLTGTIPSTFCTNPSSSLFDLDLSENSLVGPVPPTLGNCSSLSYLILSENDLSGTVPSTLSSLPLKTLDLSFNNLYGLVPRSIYNVSSMVYLSMGMNQLEGTLPDDIGLAMPELQALTLHGNKFRGRLPSSLANATGLYIIDLSVNNFSGEVGVQLGGLQKLYQLSLATNRLEAGDWGFMESLANCSRLRFLILSQNRIQGKIPAVVGNLSRTMEWLEMDGNQMTEYGMGDRLSTRGDVYSYGILLLEMLTGRRPTDQMLEEGMGLRQFVEAAFPERVMEILDQTLLPSENGGDIDSVLDGSSRRVRLEQCLISIFRIGLLCSKEAANERMEMRDVVAEMQAIRATYLKGFPETWDEMKR